MKLNAACLIILLFTVQLTGRSLVITLSQGKAEVIDRFATCPSVACTKNNPNIVKHMMNSDEGCQTT